MREKFAVVEDDDDDASIILEVAGGDFGGGAQVILDHREAECLANELVWAVRRQREFLKGNSA